MLLEGPAWLQAVLGTRVPDELRALEATARNVRFGVSFSDTLSERRPTVRATAPAPRADRRRSRAKLVAVIAPSAALNPYREASKKREAFELYKRSGERPAIRDAIKALGVTAATAEKWLYFFRSYTNRCGSRRS
jgi:hypothetical protein